MTPRIAPTALLRALIGATALAATHAHALSPATEPQLLCGGSHVVEATVESADVAPQACILDATHATTCACAGRLSLRVTQVLGVRASVASYPEDVGISKGGAVSVQWMQSLFPPVRDGDATCAKIHDDLLAKPLLASIYTHYGLWGDGTTHVNRPPYGAHYWPIDQRDWAMGIMERAKTSPDHDCPLALAESP